MPRNVSLCCVVHASTGVLDLQTCVVRLRRDAMLVTSVLEGFNRGELLRSSFYFKSSPIGRTLHWQMLVGLETLSEPKI